MKTYSNLNANAAELAESLENGNISYVCSEIIVSPFAALLAIRVYQFLSSNDAKGTLVRGLERRLTRILENTAF